MKKEHQDLLRKILGKREKTEPMHYRDVQAALPETNTKQVTKFLDAASDVACAM